MIYAQINEVNKVIGISILSGEVIKDNLILIEEYNTKLLGKIYNLETEEFEPPE